MRKPPQDSRDLALENLQGVFARYPLGAVEGCPCCVSADDQAALRQGDLSRYAFKALSTWGDVDDFRHFLPVLLEATFYGGQDIDFETVAGKLQYAHWEQWPNEEQEAVRAFLMAWWRHLLQSNDGLSASTFLHGIRQLGDLIPYLEAWQAVDTFLAALRLAEYVNENGDDLIRAASSGKIPLRADRQIVAFLRQTWVRERLEAAFFAARSDEESRELSIAVDRAGWLNQVS